MSRRRVDFGPGWLENLEKKNEQFLRFWRKNDIVHNLWYSKEARKLLYKIRYKGYSYNGSVFYFNSFINEKLSQYKYCEGGWIYDPEEISHRPKPMNLHSQLSFPYYEIDKELQYDRQRLSIQGRTIMPINVTKFIEPYSKKFYCHISNPALPDIENRALPDIENRAGHKCDRYKPYCDVFSSSCGIDLHVTYCETRLVNQPSHVKDTIFKPAVNNLIQQLQVIELSRKSEASLNELLRMAHERNVNLFVRFSSFTKSAATNFFTITPLRASTPSPSYQVFEKESNFLDLQHSLPISSEVFFRNPTIMHIKRKKYALRSLIQVPDQPRCKHCNTIITCPQCHICIFCGWDQVQCRHATNLGLLRQEKNMPLSLSLLAGLVCRRRISMEVEKCYPNADDIANSSIGKVMPKPLIQYLETFEQQNSDMVARFRLETNIEKVELRRRQFYLESQQSHAMFFETRCANMKKSENPIHDRCEYLSNPQLSPRVLHTDWNRTIYSSGVGKQQGLWMEATTRREGRDAELVPNWIHSKVPIPGFYHTEQICTRSEQIWVVDYDTREEWFSLYGTRDLLAREGEIQLVQDENGQWSRTIPPHVPTTSLPTQWARLITNAVDRNRRNEGRGSGITIVPRFPVYGDAHMTYTSVIQNLEEEDDDDSDGDSDDDSDGHDGHESDISENIFSMDSD